MNYLRLEYEAVAWAATAAGCSMAGLYYGELWAAARNQAVPPASPEAMARLDGGDNVQKIFRKVSAPLFRCMEWRMFEDVGSSYFFFWRIGTRYERTPHQISEFCAG